MGLNESPRVAPSETALLLLTQAFIQSGLTLTDVVAKMEAEGHPIVRKTVAKILGGSALPSNDHAVGLHKVLGAPRAEAWRMSLADIATIDAITADAPVADEDTADPDSGTAPLDEDTSGR